MSNRRWVVLALVFFGILISYIDRGNLSIAAAALMRDFSLPPSSMGVLLSAFFWTYAAFQIPAGALVDRFGIRRTYAGAFLLWSLASASIALSRGMADVLVSRMLLGFGEAVGPIASLSFIRRNFAGADQGLPTAIYIAGQNFGPALGTLLGAQLLDSMGWRFLFAITGLGALVWLPFWWFMAPRDTATAHPAPQVDAPKPAIPWGLVLRSRTVWMMQLCIFLTSYYWYFVLTWVPTYLTSSRGFSTTEMGRVLSLPLFIMAIVNIIAGKSADRLASRSGRVFQVRVAFAVVGFAGSSSLLLLLALPGREWAMPVLLLAMCFTGVGNTNYWSMAQHAPPAYMVGRTIGFLNTISQIAGATAPLITGWILGPQKDFQVAIALAGAAPLLAAVCLLIAGPRGLDKMKEQLAGAA